MAYRSDYSINVFGGNPETYKKIFDAIQKEGGIPFDRPLNGHYRDDKGGYAYVENTDWDDCEQLLSKIARRFPGVTIHIDVSGEDKDDDWKARFRNRSKETVRKVETFPPFTRLLLPGEEAPVTKSHTLIAATLIEVDYEGTPSPTLLTGKTPGEVMKKVVKAIRHAEKRGFKVSYNEEEIASFLAKKPKEARGGLWMAVYGWDNRFILHKDNIKLP